MSEARKPVRGWLRVLLIVIPFLFFVSVFQMVGSMITGLKFSREMAPTPFQSAVIELFMLAGTFSVVALFRRLVDRESFVSLGFGMKNFRREAESGFWMGVAMISSGFLILLLMRQISWDGINPDTKSIFLSVIFFVAVAFTEELFFRGYVLGNMMLSMNRYIALLVSSLIFALVHIPNAHFTAVSFLSILLAGLLLGVPYIYTKSLWLPISLHFSWNFFQGTIFGFSVSGNKEYALITQSRPADTMINGGEFGFEGSLLAVIFLVVAITALVFYYRRKENLVGLSAPSVLQVTTEEEQPQTGI